LAADHLAAHHEFARQAWQLVGTGPLWREVVLLAVGQLIYLIKGRDMAIALIGNLCPRDPLDTPKGWWQAWMAGDALLETGPNRARDDPHGAELADRVVARLVALLRGGHLSPVERAAAGNTLARLGDPRFRSDAWYLPDEPLLGFVEIPQGPFMMGSDKERDPEAIDHEREQHEVTLAGSYISRYPVTAAQFRAFIEDSGFQLEQDDSMRGVPNHPVVHITWDDARRYCDWLTEQLRAWEDTPEPLASLVRQEGWCVTLPSEAEWEKAAREADGRMYPWGDEPDAHRANYADTGIDTTSAVGCFPGGASPYGIEDLSGNVGGSGRGACGVSIRTRLGTKRYHSARIWKPRGISPVCYGGARSTLKLGSCGVPGEAGAVRSSRTGTSGFASWCGHRRSFTRRFLDAAFDKRERIEEATPRQRIALGPASVGRRGHGLCTALLPPAVSCLNSQGALYSTYGMACRIYG
jgi:hypothetical protein